MSDDKKLPATEPTPDPEMLKNLDLLMNYEMVDDKDSDFEFLQDMNDLEQAPSEVRQGDK